MAAVEKANTLEAGLLKKDQNDKEECRITVVVFLSTLVAVGGSFCFGCAIGYSSVAQSGIVKDLGLSLAQYSMFGSLLTFGGMIGAVFSGKVADALGRRGTMWFADVLCISGWLAVALAKGSLWLDAGRLSLGFGVGLFSYVIPVYIAEIAPKHVRGAFVFANTLMQCFGFSFFFVIGNFVSWRRLALIGFIPCALQVVTLFFIPESPRWLGKRGEEQECKTALQCLLGHDADISQEINSINNTVDKFDQSPRSGIKDLFQRKYSLHLIIGVGIMLLQQLSGHGGVTYYANSLFERGGFPSSIGSTIMAMLLPPESVMVLMLVEKMGRRPLLMTSAAGMCFFSLVLSASFCLLSFGLLVHLTPVFTCIGVLGFIAAFVLGMGGLPWVIMSEIFPINLKVSAGTLVTFVNWSLGWLMTYAFNFLLQWSESGTFLIFSGICAASVVFVYMLVPETKGRTLEEIQAALADFLH